MAPDNRPGLYIHVPFCARACPYCDFDFVVGATADLDRYLQGLDAEVDARGLDGIVARTLYLGGGTPSLLGAQGLQRLLRWVAERFDVTTAIETTVEINPEHASPALFAALSDLGCTRVSLGAQTLDRRGLVQLGRRHDAAASVAAVRDAAAADLAVSTDLIVGWPGQTTAGVDRDLDALYAAGAEHLSIYALTIEADTPWPGLVARGLRQMPDDEHQARLLSHVEARCAQWGWLHYEVASYAAATPLRSRHNLGYWTGVDYLGLGPSAASACFSSEGAVQRRTNVRGFAPWCERAAHADSETLTPEHTAAEGLWLGLRVLSGMSIAAFLGRFSGLDRAWLDARIEPSVRRGDLVVDGDRLAIAPGRWLMHDAIAAAVL